MPASKASLSNDGSGLKADGNGGYKRNQGNNGSSVRQIIINLNVANTTVSGTDKLGYTEYSDRPVFFYYTGPEKNLSGSAEVVDYYDGYNEASHVRDSLPVIINFNANFRGIFFFPNSPVVINGNEKDFYGYVIAKEFVMLKTYENETYSDGVTRGGDFVRYVAADEKNDVYYNYDPSLLVEGTKLISQSDDFARISINGQTKYVLKSDLITDASDLITIGGKTYSRQEAGSAEAMAYASGNGKINYYYTKRKKKNEGWTLAGTGWLDRKTAVAKDQLAVFKSGWSYNNSGNDDNDNGNPNGKGVWRVKELLADGSEGGWLDETDEYKSRFLLKVAGDIATNPPQYVYATAEELMSKIDGYTKVDNTNWKKDDAREYVKVTSGGQTYYLPKNFVSFDSNTLVPEDMTDIIPVKYWKNNDEVTGFADVSSNPEKYYKIYQDDIYGNDTTLNPMFVDELGNVQYRLQKNADGTDVEYDKEDDPVPYETIEPTVSPTSDDVLMNRAIETAVKEMIANLPEDETANLDTREKQIAYLKENYSDTYTEKVNNYFHEYFNYLEDDNVKFFNKDDFHLATSVFDNFQLVKMTQYSYLNERETETADKRSINNFFTNADAIRTD